MTEFDFQTQNVMELFHEQLLLVSSGNSKIELITEYMYEICREDSFRHETLLKQTQDVEKFHSLIHQTLLLVESVSVADQLASLATGFIIHDESNRNPTDATRLALDLIDRKSKCSNAGVLAAIANLMKVSKFRAHLWNISGVHVLIRASLSVNKSDGTSQYQGLISTWMLSFNEKFIPHLVESGIFIKFITILKSTPRKEKFVRLGLDIIENSLACKDALELLIDEKVGDLLDSFMFENWREEELYTNISKVTEEYLHAIRDWSTIERYSKELNSGRLKPGYLHEAEFWQENVMEFEDQEFYLIRKLISLLRSSDVMTVAVACHDIGEFARLHPTGKQVLQKYEAKDMLLALVNHKERDVERECLLALQKLMLNNPPVA